MLHDIDPGGLASSPGGSGPGPGGSPRFLLYSHDSWGLGHLRRSLTIASALVRAFPEAGAMVVTGSPCATFFPRPPRVALVKLPAVTKDPLGNYAPRNLPGPLEFTVRLRSAILREVFRSFDPDLLIVDHQVIGLLGEALETIDEARRRGVPTVLGVRDIIDSPEAVAREWSSPAIRRALRGSYDRVCVYGTPEVFDPRTEYAIPPELGARLEFTGYVVRNGATYPEARRAVPRVLVTMGGGEDGARRIQACLEALELAPRSWETVIVGGPLLSGGEARHLRQRARALGDVQLHRFHADLPRLLAESQAVVAMAGYNTCAEVLLHARPSVLLPRSRPRREQVIRAERLARLGLARSLPDPKPVELRAAIEESLAGGSLRGPIPSLEGRRRLCEIAAELLALPIPGTGADDVPSMVS